MCVGQSSGQPGAAPALQVHMTAGQMHRSVQHARRSVLCLCFNSSLARLAAGHHEDEAGLTVEQCTCRAQEHRQQAVHDGSPITELLKDISCSPATSSPQLRL